jgi:hypothetical protein
LIIVLTIDIVLITILFFKWDNELIFY